jgi:hypothetical protein
MAPNLQFVRIPNCQAVRSEPSKVERNNPNMGVQRHVAGDDSRMHIFVCVSSRVRQSGTLPLACVVIQDRSTKTGVTMARTKKKIVRREWTKDDVRQLKTMAKAKAGVTRISKSLKRTAGATSVMAAKLGVSLSTRT